MSGTAKKAKSGWLGLAVDYLPVLLFFLTYRLFSPESRDNMVGEVFAVIRATAVFILAALVALGLSQWKLGRISPMLWLSTVLIVGFGSVTIFLQDPLYIQLKPTAIYLLFGVLLLGGVARGRPLLKDLLEAAFEGLSEVGWIKLSRNWGWFFLALAVLNEVLRRQLDFGDWIAAKLWVFLPLTFVFTFVQIPMLLRHGMAEPLAGDAPDDPPDK